MYVSAAKLDATHFVIGYEQYSMTPYITRGKVVVGVTDGATAISSFGTPVTLINKGSYFSVSTVDSTHFVAAFQDGDNSWYGTVIIGTTNGATTISLGLPIVFNAGNASYVSASSLSTTSFVIAYQDGGNSSFGTAIAGDPSKAGSAVGIAQASASSGATVSVVVAGVSDIHVGLTAGSLYYSTRAVAITITNTGYPVGVALSTTEIMVNPQGDTTSAF